MKTIKIREQGTKLWEKWEVDDYRFLDGSVDYDMEAECWAEDVGLGDGDVVEVFRVGKYRISVHNEPEYVAMKI